VLLACDQPISPRRLTPDQTEVLRGLLQREIVIECCGKLIAAPLIPEAIRDQLKSALLLPTAEAGYPLVQLA
jgi:hypothetical protein